MLSCAPEPAATALIDDGARETHAGAIVPAARPAVRLASGLFPVEFISTLNEAFPPWLIKRVMPGGRLIAGFWVMVTVLPVVFADLLPSLFVQLIFQSML